MRGLSLIQPWASLVALGHKRIETRDWASAYRGDLLIHASKHMPPEARELADALHRAGILPAILPRGSVVGYARLTGYEKTETLAPRVIGSPEFEYGNYEPLRFGWFLEGAKALPYPIPHKGALGLWTVPQVLLDLVAGQGVL